MTLSTKGSRGELRFSLSKLDTIEEVISTRFFRCVFPDLLVLEREWHGTGKLCAAVWQRQLRGHMP